MEEEKNKTAIIKGEQEANVPIYDEKAEIFLAINKLMERVAELEKPAKAQVVTRDMQRQHRAIQLTQQVAGMLATEQVTEEQLRGLPGPFAASYVRFIGPDWVDKAVALFEAAKAEKGQ